MKTHYSKSAQSVESLELVKHLETIKNKIILRGDLEYASVEKQLESLNQLKEFELGQWLIVNRGLNGYWTHDLIHTFGQGKPRSDCVNDLEYSFYNLNPIVQSTRQRSNIFNQILQKNLKDSAVYMSVPSGLMGDLLSLDTNNFKGLEFIAVDLDSNSLELAQKASEKMDIASIKCRFIHADAWKLEQASQQNNLPLVDVLCSNGLNIYEKNPDKVIELYSQFAASMKQGGVLITSFLPPSPAKDKKPEWDMTKLDPKALLDAKILLGDILDASWRCFMSKNEMVDVLSAAGFKNFEIHYDEARIFPTITAVKQ